MMQGKSALRFVFLAPSNGQTRIEQMLVARPTWAARLLSGRLPVPNSSEPTPHGRSRYDCTPLPQLSVGAQGFPVKPPISSSTRRKGDAPAQPPRSPWCAGHESGVASGCCELNRSYTSPWQHILTPKDVALDGRQLFCSHMSTHQLAGASPCACSTSRAPPDHPAPSMSRDEQM